MKLVHQQKEVKNECIIIKINFILIKIEYDTLKKNLANICITLAGNVEVISQLNDSLFSLECIPEAVHIAVQNASISPYDRANKLVSSLLSTLKTHSNPSDIFFSFINSLNIVGLTGISEMLSKKQSKYMPFHYVEF